jgi:S-adenosylmethionine decarboxylase
VKIGLSGLTEPIETNYDQNSTSCNTLTFAGKHLIIDLWQAKHLDNIQLIDQLLRECVEIAGATLLDIHLHHFTPNNGVTGVAILAESHISIHTWPEREYAAVDIFMCGKTQPEKCIQLLCQYFETNKLDTSEHLRGVRESI